jgi:DNA invertase Pin-like site-specific DNA recombinase
VDTTTPAGELVAIVMCSVGQWDRRAIGARTKDALAVKRAQGVRLGPPPLLPASVRARIVRDRRRGLSFRAIVARLNDAQVPTAQGDQRWYASTVRAGVEASLRVSPAA